MRLRKDFVAAPPELYLEHDRSRESQQFFNPLADNRIEVSLRAATIRFPASERLLSTCIREASAIDGRRRRVK
jgi:hypothetical protein